MPPTFDLVLRNATVVTADRTGLADIAVHEGRISAVGGVAAGSGGEEIDCTGLHILPGVMDTQVHFREPGAEHKEDLETGSRSAVMGGVTAVFEMPNTNPPTTSADALSDKVRRATGRMHCDFAFFVGATRERHRRRRTGAAAGRGGHQDFHGILDGITARRRRRDVAHDPVAHEASRCPSTLRTSRGCASGCIIVGKAIRRPIRSGAMMSLP